MHRIAPYLNLTMTTIICFYLGFQATYMHQLPNCEKKKVQVGIHTMGWFSSALKSELNQ